MGGARSACDGNSSSETQPAAESDNALAHEALAAEQMGDAGKVEPQAGRIRNCCARSPAPGREQAETMEESHIRLELGWTDIKPENHDARLGERHAGMKAECLGSGANGGDLDPAADAVSGDERRMPARPEPSRGALLGT